MYAKIIYHLRAIAAELEQNMNKYTGEDVIQEAQGLLDLSDPEPQEDAPRRTRRVTIYHNWKEGEVIVADGLKAKGLNAEEIASELYRIMGIRVTPGAVARRLSKSRAK